MLDVNQLTSRLSCIISSTKARRTDGLLIRVLMLSYLDEVITLAVLLERINQVDLVIFVLILQSIRVINTLLVLIMVV